MFAVMYVAMASCSTFSSEEDSYKAIEPLKDLSGVWTIETVSRNGVDITNDFDFSKFKLKLNDDGSFKNGKLSALCGEDRRNMDH